MKTTDQRERLSKLSPEQRARLMEVLWKQSAEREQSNAITPRPDQHAAPLSFAQERLWFFDQLEPGSPAYNIPSAVGLSGLLNVNAIEQTLNEIQRRHESLRASFSIREGKPVQVIRPAKSLPIPLIDISALPEPNRECLIRELTAEEAYRPFRLAQGELFRVKLVRITDNQHVLLLTMHHIVSDGWSMGVLIAEVGALYAAFAAAQPSPLPPLAVQYADFAYWQRQWLSGEVFDRQMGYWQAQLAGAAAALDLPTDRPRPHSQTFRGSREKYLIPAPQAQAIKAASRKESVTLFMLLLSAFDALLYRYSGQKDISVGTPIANRRWVETEGLIGFFANTLVMRTDLSDDPTFSDLLKQIREVALGAYAHQDLPFEKLVEVLQPHRDTSRHPLFQVMLALQNTPLPSLELPGLTIEFLDTDSNTARFDLLLAVTDTPQGLACVLEYNADLFDAETIKHLLTHYHSLLERIAVDPNVRLSELVAPIPAQKLSIVVTSTFTSRPLEDSLAFWAEQLRLPLAVQFAPYGQVFQHLLDPASPIANNAEGLSIILLRLEDWCQGRSESDGDFFGLLEENVNNFLTALESSEDYRQGRCLICLCPPSNAKAANPAMRDSIVHLENLITRRAKRNADLEILNYQAIIEAYDVQEINDAQTDEIGHIPYTPEFFAALGTAIVRKLLAFSQPRYKAILLDCDETLWGGVCGEDGPGNIELQPAHLELQRFMLRQYEAGSRLCLCSKNREHDIIETFILHTEMPLKLAHFSSTRINWEPTSNNILSLSRELQIPPDNMIYISSNPVEFAEVRGHNPDVLALRLPSDPQEIALFLNHLWLFDSTTDGLS
jgi:Condensation domain